MIAYVNGLDDQFGLLHIRGNYNSAIANHISLSIDTRYIRPPAARPVIINVLSGSGDYIANNNHVVATTEEAEATNAPPWQSAR